MLRMFLLLALIPLAAWAQSVPQANGTSPPPTNSVALDGHNFTLPAGFTIERAAGQPLVNWPIVADFDEQGRLYVAEAGGAITKEEVQQQKKAHRVVRLVDSDGDGRFDKSTVFLDGIAFPEGAMWRAGSLYVAAPPQIWRLTDTNDDGVSDQREIWFDGKTITGCANDLHGPYRGPDGWIYWCKGAFAKQTYTLPTGKEFNTRASHIFRARPDGSGIEPVMTGGMDNPVDTVFTPGGERIFSTTVLQRPAAGLRDGLIHAVYGGIYGKDQEAIYDADHKWTSPDLMPVLVHHGPSAPCGLHCLESDQFGPDYQNNIFSCQFNLRKIGRHVLKPSGSTFTTEDYDFLVSDNSNFHPTAAIEDADGTLLVVNTGGWYKLCCPSSQLVKADIVGAVYRIRREAAQKVSDPRGLQIAWTASSNEQLAALLGDGRAAVRRRAVETLALRGAAALTSIEPLLENPKSSPRAALAALGVASRQNDPAARKMVRAAIGHADEDVRQAAIHTISVWRDKNAVSQLIGVLHSTSLPKRRVAAEALGRMGDAAAVSAILAALADAKNDRALDHSLTYALIEIGDEASIRPALAAKEPAVRRAAMVVLDQIGAQLDPDLVLGARDDPNEKLRDSARWIAGRHPEWDEKLAGYLRGRLARPMLQAEQPQVIELLTKLTKSVAVQDLLAAAARDATRSPTS